MRARLKEDGVGQGVRFETKTPYSLRSAAAMTAVPTAMAEPTVPKRILSKCRSVNDADGPDLVLPCTLGLAGAETGARTGARTGAGASAETGARTGRATCLRLGSWTLCMCNLPFITVFKFFRAIRSLLVKFLFFVEVGMPRLLALLLSVLFDEALLRRELFVFLFKPRGSTELRKLFAT